MRAERKLAIFGAGAHGRDTLSVVEACLRKDPDGWDLVGFVSERPEDHGQTLRGYPVQGGWDWLAANATDLRIVIAIGDPAERRRIATAAGLIGLQFATLVHPDANLAPGTRIGAGSIVSAGVLSTDDVTIGDHCLLNLGVVAPHDVRIGDFCSIGPGVSFAGGVQLEEGCDVGCGASFVPRVTVGAWSILGAGAVVHRDLPAHVTAVGCPARIVRTRAAPAAPDPRRMPAPRR